MRKVFKSEPIRCRGSSYRRLAAIWSCRYFTKYHGNASDIVDLSELCVTLATNKDETQWSRSLDRDLMYGNAAILKLARNHFANLCKWKSENPGAVDGCHDGTARCTFRRHRKNWTWRHPLTESQSGQLESGGGRSVHQQRHRIFGDDSDAWTDHSRARGCSDKFSHWWEPETCNSMRCTGSVWQNVGNWTVFQSLRKTWSKYSKTLKIQYFYIAACSQKITVQFFEI